MLLIIEIIIYILNIYILGFDSLYILIISIESCITHCKQPNFTPLQGTENCSKGDKCPAVVGCKFSH